MALTLPGRHGRPSTLDFVACPKSVHEGWCQGASVQAMAAPLWLIGDAPATGRLEQALP